MKRKYFLFLTFLLSQTTFAWGMQPFDGGKALCPFDPTCESEKRKIIPLPMAPSFVKAKDPSHSQLNTSFLALENKLVLSPENEGQILTHLQSFGLSFPEASTLWENFRELMTTKGKLPLKLGCQDSYFIASGLWRASQEREQAQKGSSALDPSFLLSCLLTDKLFVQGKSFKPQDFRVLKNLIQSNPYFRILDFYQCGLEDAQVASLLKIPHLKELSLKANNITDQALPGIIAHPKLETLKLSKNKLTSMGAKILSQSNRITNLSLDKNDIGNEGAGFLAQNTVLSFLNLADTNIGSPGAIALSFNTALEALILERNKIDDAGALPFLSNNYLRGLELRNNQISKEVLFHVELFIHDRNKFLSQLSKEKTFAVDLSFQPLQKSRIRILSIDGGGIRGVLPSYILNHVAHRLSQKIGTPFHFAKHADLIAGTSTGGLLSLGLSVSGQDGLPKYTPQDLLELYLLKGRNIFSSPALILKDLDEPRYSSENFEKILEEYFGNSTLSSGLSHTLITAFDERSREHHIFDSVQAKISPLNDFMMKDVGRAASSAPTYFSTAKIKNTCGDEFQCADGGIHANNPALLALKRAKALYPNADEYIVFSFGTGQTGQQKLVPVRDEGLLKWKLNAANVLMNNANIYTENLLKQECNQDPRIKYVRIQPSLNEVSQGTNTIEESLQDLLQSALQTLEKDKAKIDYIISEFYKGFEKPQVQK